MFTERQKLSKQKHLKLGTSLWVFGYWIWLLIRPLCCCLTCGEVTHQSALQSSGQNGEERQRLGLVPDMAHGSVWVMGLPGVLKDEQNQGKYQRRSNEVYSGHSVTFLFSPSSM